MVVAVVIRKWGRGGGGRGEGRGNVRVPKDMPPKRICRLAACRCLSKR